VGDDVAGGAAITEAGNVLAQPAAVVGQLEWRDNPSVIGAGVNFGLRGQLSDASSALRCAGCAGAECAPSDVAGIDGAVDFGLTEAAVSVGAFLNADDCLLKLCKRGRIQRPRHCGGGAIPDVNAVLGLRGLAAHQDAILAGHRDAINRGARAARLMLLWVLTRAESFHAKPSTALST
jgi:hypothetical protein